MTVTCDAFIGYFVPILNRPAHLPDHLRTDGLER